MQTDKKNADEEILEQAEETVDEQAGDETAQEEEQPKSELELLQEKYDEQSNNYLRLMAEYDNFRRRSTREKDEIYGNATSAAIAKFLPVLDNLERAAAFDRGSEDFAKGFDMILTGLQDTLSSLGIAPVGEIGEAFDPVLHHAVMHVEDESLGENVVSQVLQKGYKMGERVIRCAMVQTAN